MRFIIKCPSCNGEYPVSKYVPVLPCGHILDKRDYYNNETSFEIEGLLEDGLNLFQAVDAIYKKTIKNFRNNK